MLARSPTTDIFHIIKLSALLALGIILAKMFLTQKKNLLFVDETARISK